MINWKVRLKNRDFWLAIIPMALLLVQNAAALAGLRLELGDLGSRLVELVKIAFGILALLGIVNDPTTQSLADSDLAMTYDAPKPKGA